MNISYYTVKDLPVVVIDELYNEEALEKIWHELTFVSKGDKLKSPSETGSATDDSGELLKKNKAIGLDNIYAIREVSDILTENRVIWDLELVNQLMDHHAFFRYLRWSNMDSTLISYYEDSDYYSPHRDDAIITALTWFYQTPKQFNGGDLTIEDTLKIECRHNRCVLFPSMLYHGVDSISLDKSLQGKNFGRYAMSQFITLNG